MALAQQSEGFLTLLKKKNFLLLWLAQLISMTILQASSYALIVLIAKTTNSATLIALAIISFSLPAVLFGAPAGVFVDHLDKRLVLWGSNCLRALATFLFIFVLVANVGGLFSLYLLTFLISTIGQIFSPAEGATIPMLVTEEELVPALSLFNITFMLSQALGFILLGPITITFLPTLTLGSLHVTSVDQLYAIIALLYLVCAFLILAIKPANFKQNTQRADAQDVTSETIGAMHNLWREMKEGWHFVRRDKQLFLAVVQLSFAGVLILVIGLLATPIVTQLLHYPAAVMALIFAPAGVGLVVGSLFMPRITRRWGKPRTVLVGSITLAIATLLLPLLTILINKLEPQGTTSNPLLLLVIALCMLVAGVALNFINTPAQAAMQERSPAWIKGRVLSLQIVLYNACSIPIVLSFGALTDFFHIDRVLYLLAFSVLAFGLWGTFYERRLKQRSSLNMATPEIPAATPVSAATPSEKSTADTQAEQLATSTAKQID